MYTLYMYLNISPLIAVVLSKNLLFSWICGDRPADDVTPSTARGNESCLLSAINAVEAPVPAERLLAMKKFNVVSASNGPAAYGCIIVCEKQLCPSLSPFRAIPSHQHSTQGNWLRWGQVFDMGFCLHTNFNYATMQR